MSEPVFSLDLERDGYTYATYFCIKLEKPENWFVTNQTEEPGNPQAEAGRK